MWTPLYHFRLNSISTVLLEGWLLALNNPQRFICHQNKPEPLLHKPCLSIVYSKIIIVCVWVLLVSPVQTKLFAYLSCSSHTNLKWYQSLWKWFMLTYVQKKFSAGEFFFFFYNKNIHEIFFFAFLFLFLNNTKWDSNLDFPVKIFWSICISEFKEIFSNLLC